MPFRSEAQRKFLYANHPEIAKEFGAATPKDAILPKHVKGSEAQKRHVRTVKGLSRAFPNR